jgi:hypothetical protein
MHASSGAIGASGWPRNCPRDGLTPFANVLDEFAALDAELK